MQHRHELVERQLLCTVLDEGARTKTRPLATRWQRYYHLAGVRAPSKAPPPPRAPLVAATPRATYRSPGPARPPASPRRQAPIRAPERIDGACECTDMASSVDAGFVLVFVVPSRSADCLRLWPLSAGPVFVLDARQPTEDMCLDEVFVSMVPMLDVFPALDPPSHSLLTFSIPPSSDSHRSASIHTRPPSAALPDRLSTPSHASAATVRVFIGMVFASLAALVAPCILTQSSIAKTFGGLD
ncbi:hypothetical protein HYPSUDRAFT_204622 [Hypholoma sublateritium FD-334 SS-4]|uniref:Uncharacterized protein n=1 Tax=Hypholoma sublateritium (strain FD-334 SS-4) TaxID=945553 RepID=A0A0D2KY02_HYPSF|nr:hypothetical protein HYPSUDRAFT_204622 [Hypholoma sublateritium FD-334 SS-4]